MLRNFCSAVLLACLALALSAQANQSNPVRVASKNFAENYLLAEIVAQLLEGEGIAVERAFGLGGTLICYQALLNEEIDLYVEYTGTLSQAILQRPELTGRDELNSALTERGIRLLPQLGFNNTYAIAVRSQLAESLGLRNIGDLAKHPQLRLVFSHEFLERGDGWPGLSKRYALPQSVEGIEHALAYQAIADGAIDVTDAYSTDGELSRYPLRVLADDLAYFPAYMAAPLVRTDWLEQAPVAAAWVRRLAATIDAETMQRLNAKVAVEGMSYVEVASAFLDAQRQPLGLSARVSEIPTTKLWPQLTSHVLRHLQLTGLALVAAILIGLAVSLAVFSNPRLANAVVYFCGLLQTVPSLALLALMIPIFGIGFTPAVVALFLYSLLPIVRNAVTALSTIDPTLVRVATALGLSRWQQLRHLRLPLSLPMIFAGIRTAAVISIGTATLAAFIGAGGLGEPIVVGLSLNDTDMILRGAIPAAMLAILAEFLFAAVQKRVSRGYQ
ncbi:MAG: ABC transporter permease [Gammaproteobacteria bacterium]|nr:ABC transporter permease [Gammaproteobacteria bacterium]